MKATYNDKRRYKYAIIKNATGDTELAKRDRSLGDQAFEEKYGFQVRKTEIKKDESQIKRTQYVYKRYEYLRSIGYKPETARKLKYKPIKEVAGQIKPRNISVAFNRPIESTKDKRKEQWKKWAEGYVTPQGTWKSNMPEWVEKMAEQINRDTKLADGTDLDETARYGYAICYYAYIENKSIDEIRDQFKLDSFDGDIYKYNKRIG